MSRKSIADLAFCVFFTNPSLANMFRSYTRAHLASQAVLAAKEIESRGGNQEVALLFGAMYGESLASFSPSQIRDCVEQTGQTLDAIATAVETLVPEEVSVQEPSDQEPDGDQQSQVTGNAEPSTGSTTGGSTTSEPSSGNTTTEPSGGGLKKGYGIAVAELTIAKSYREALIRANLHTVGEVIGYETTHAEGVAELPDIGPVARERIMAAIRTVTEG